MPNRISYVAGHRSLWSRLKGWVSDRTRGLPDYQIVEPLNRWPEPSVDVLVEAKKEKAAHRKPRKPRTPKKPRNKQAVGSPNTVHK